MLTIIPIESGKSALFATVDALYESAFPLHEKRDHAAKLRALSHPDYCLQAWFDGEQFVGLIGAWQFDGYAYIEHLAVNDKLRAQGYGKRMLHQFLQQSPRTLLEIDPLTTDIAHRRLRFYQAMGFQLNDYHHHHPTYHAQIADHELLVLSYPVKLNEQDYQRFFDDLCHQVMAKR